MPPITRLTPLLALPLCALACINGPDLPKVKSILPDASGAFQIEAPKINLASVKVSLNETKLSTIESAADAELSEEKAQVVYRQIVERYELMPPGKATPAVTNDYAGALLFLRRFSEAVAALQKLEQEHPGDYATASNLGTAYELVGDLPKAVEWIREGMKRNAASHDGTEWLHVAILETKIKLQEDAGWLRKTSVLHAAPGHSDAEVLKAIKYQLNERLRFVRPADPVVCDLFYQAALRMTNPEVVLQRRFYLQESLRFGDLRKREVELLLKS